VPDTPIAKLEEQTRLEVARLMKALLSEGGFIEEERTLARIIEQHPEYAGTFMDADKHFSSGDPDSPFVHIGLHLIVERGVVSRDHELSRQSSDKSWHDAVHERAEAVAKELFGQTDAALSEEAS
jgi:predicted nucleic acid-binding protein